jgi:hypothetical protein
MAGELGMKIEYYQWADLSAILTGAPLPVVVLPVFSQLQRTKITQLSRIHPHFQEVVYHPLLPRSGDRYPRLESLGIYEANSEQRWTTPTEINRS